MTLGAVRRAFAEEVRAVGHLGSDALVEAFARVPREQFLGPGPWLIARPPEPGDPYRTTSDADPRHVYHDVVVALDPVRQLNNGQPSSLARWIVVSQAGIFDCIGARDPGDEAELLALARSGGARQIGAVVVEPHDPGEGCLAHLPGFCLQR
jgi:hypothetical protein